MAQMLINQTIPPVEIQVDEPVSVRRFLEIAEEQLRAEESPYFEEFLTVKESLLSSSREAYVDGEQTRLGAAGTVTNSSRIDTQDKGDQGYKR